MSIIAPKISDLSTNILKALLKQRIENKEETYDIEKELKKRFQDLPIMRLCLSYEKEQNKTIKKLIIDILAEQLPFKEEMMELHSVRSAISKMSLGQLCNLINVSYNALIEEMAREELKGRLCNNKNMIALQEFEKDFKKGFVKVLTKKEKGELKYGKYQRK